MDEPLFFRWMGWTAEYSILKAAGWVIERKRKYRNLRDEANSSSNNEYLYLRHPSLKMLGLLTMTEGMTRYELDFLTPERNQRKKPTPVYEAKDLGEGDISNLFEMILDIQSRRPKRPAKRDNVMPMKTGIAV